MLKTGDLARRRFELMAAEYLQRMGARMRERRETLGLTQEDVARALPGRVTGNQVSRWERGGHRPQDDTLERLAEVLRVEVGYFMMAEPDKAETPDLLGGDRLARIEVRLAEADADRAEMRALIAQQNELLARQSGILERIEGLVEALGAPTGTTLQDHLAQLVRETAAEVALSERSERS